MFNLYTLEKSIVKHMNAAQVPGLALSVIRDGEIVYARGFGVTSVEDGGVAVTPETLFRIGSTTTALTGTAVMRLVEAGKLDLERPVSAYLDWLTFSEPGAEKRITLRMLLSHTSGLPGEIPLTERLDPGGLEAFLRTEIPRYPLHTPPGKLFSYSHLNPMIAGSIAQAVYGKPYPQMMQELLFDPLNMQRSTFDPLVAMTYALAQSHTLDKNGRLAVEHRFVENTAGYPADFAIASALDMAQFALLHLNQGQVNERTLLSPETIASMQQSQAPLFTRKERHYGLAFCLEKYQGRRVVGHDGTIGSFGCQFALLPDDGIGAVLLYNRLDLDGPGIMACIFDRLLSTRKKVSSQNRAQHETVSSGRTHWKAYAGTYLSPYIGLVKVAVVNNQLTLELYDERIPLQAQRKDVYSGTWGEGEMEVTVGFVREKNGCVEYIVVNPYGDDAVFHLFECKRVVLENEELNGRVQEWEEYTGTYRHPELGTYSLAFEDGQWVMTLHEEEEQALCMPIGKRLLVCRWGVFELQKDEDNGHRSMEHKGHRVILQRMGGRAKADKRETLLK